MELTYLGHQGWAFESLSGTVLMDPIFEAMGNGSRRLPVWPPRQLAFDQMHIRGIVLSHEHSDHFDLETLLLIPYRGDIFIPQLSSYAMEEILKDMGFTVRRFAPWNEFSIDGLRFCPLPTQLNDLEYDVYGFYVEDEAGRAFLTMIDAVPHPRLCDWSAQLDKTRVMYNFTNNFIERLPHLCNPSPQSELSMGRCTSLLIEFVETFKPQSVLVTGQGWCYPQEKKELNHKYFQVTNEQITSLARTLYPTSTWVHPQPGFVISHSDQGIAWCARDRYVNVLSPIPRDFRPGEYCTREPWSGMKAIDRIDLESVLKFITEQYASVLSGFADKLFSALHELLCINELRVRPSLFMRVLNGEEAHDFALTLGRLRFEPVVLTDNPVKQFAAGIEIWASDFLALIDGGEEAFLIYESSVRNWNHFPEVFGDNLCADLFGWFSPRFRPSEYLASYRRRVNILRERQKCAHAARIV